MMNVQEILVLIFFIFVSIEGLLVFLYYKESIVGWLKDNIAIGKRKKSLCSELRNAQNECCGKESTITNLMRENKKLKASIAKQETKYKSAKWCGEQAEKELKEKTEKVERLEVLLSAYEAAEA
jgi:septal ring factor EnvC (AmiA/AmiB activator)